MNAKELSNMEKELENISGEDTLETSSEVQTENVELQVSAEAAEEIIETESVEVAEEIIETKSVIVTIDLPQEKIEEPVAVKATKKVLQGQVISNKPDKSIIIKVVRQVSHPIYKKYYKKSKKFMAHDEKNDCNIGDVVRIRECRPLSARKSWELVEIVERAK